MKTLAVSETIKDVTGKPIEDVSKLGDDKSLLFKDVLIHCIGQFFHSRNPMENIQAVKIGQKLYETTGDLELEDAEFAVLKLAVTNALTEQRYSAVIMGPICMLYDDIGEPIIVPERPS